MQWTSGQKIQADHRRGNPNGQKKFLNESYLHTLPESRKRENASRLNL